MCCGDRLTCCSFIIILLLARQNMVNAFLAICISLISISLFCVSPVASHTNQTMFNKHIYIYEMNWFDASYLKRITSSPFSSAGGFQNNILDFGCKAWRAHGTWTVSSFVHHMVSLRTAQRYLVQADVYVKWSQPYVCIARIFAYLHKFSSESFPQCNI